MGSLASPDEELHRICLYFKQDLQSIFVCAWVCVCMCLSLYVSSEEDVCFSVGEEEGEESELLWRIVLWNWITWQILYL